LVRIIHGKHLGLLEVQKKGAFSGPLEGINGWVRKQSRGLTTARK
jgi:hypothetical protein